MTQLCVSMPALRAPDGARLMADALASAKVAAVVIMPGPDGAIAPEAALPMIAIAQKAGTAALIYGDAQLARTLRADGVHLPPNLDIGATAEEAREILGQNGIVGADAGISRHDAMLLGEMSIDYVAFGAGANGDDVEGRHELVAWWAEIFEVPVVAFDVRDAADAADLAAAAADFVSVPLNGQGDAASLSACAEAIAAVIAAPTA